MHTSGRFRRLPLAGACAFLFLSCSAFQSATAPAPPLAGDMSAPGAVSDSLLREAIQRHVGPDVTLVDSAQNTALAVQKLLKQHKLGLPKKTLGKLRVALTDQSTGFLRVAEEALGLQVGDVQLRTVQSAV